MVRALGTSWSLGRGPREYAKVRFSRGKRTFWVHVAGTVTDANWCCVYLLEPHHIADCVICRGKRMVFGECGWVQWTGYCTSMVRCPWSAVRGRNHSSRFKVGGAPDGQAVFLVCVYWSRARVRDPLVWARLFSLWPARFGDRPRADPQITEVGIKPRDGFVGGRHKGRRSKRL
jgi:hypothetical protein